MKLFSYLYVLSLIMFGAKLLHFVTWSWWLVFLPALLATGTGLALLAFLFLCYLVAHWNAD